eukprot:CAMPEP_0172510632 /NCGR_PEP_ID=MMETSP1066-20121228/230256_1 /TAXON_ID=671091 /ORGANISM="Coscinodiscus wailesii, Strain CCMP2513" /LENGTH=97 /DNA_ID=CAMNT_0013289701 /DNA_START=138 /DNA_END=428 /DNA_ORIENTATION=-
MNVVKEISEKHDVLFSNVALRFVLQELGGDVGSVTVDGVSSYLRETEEEFATSCRVRDLKEVFSFQLDDEDMEQLRFGVEEERSEEEFFDMSDRRLW